MMEAMSDSPYNCITAHMQYAYFMSSSTYISIALVLRLNSQTKEKKMRKYPKRKIQFFHTLKISF